MTDESRLTDRERIDVLLDEVSRLQSANRRLEMHVGILSVASFEMMTNSEGALLLDPER